VFRASSTLLWKWARPREGVAMRMPTCTRSRSRCQAEPADGVSSATARAAGRADRRAGAGADLARRLSVCYLDGGTELGAPAATIIDLTGVSRRRAREGRDPGGTGCARWRRLLNEGGLGPGAWRESPPLPHPLDGNQTMAAGAAAPEQAMRRRGCDARERPVVMAFFTTSG